MTRTAWSGLTAVGLVAGLALGLMPAAGSSAHAASPGAASGLPSGVPPAALRTEGALPVPAGWPFPEAFPRTSGTGRLAGGGTFWTDFLYDDQGATGVRMTPWQVALAVPYGTYG